jgi:hypothetical protein
VVVEAIMIITGDFIDFICCLSLFVVDKNVAIPIIIHVAAAVKVEVRKKLLSYLVCRFLNWTN